MPEAPPTVALDAVGVWRWHAQSGTRIALLRDVGWRILPGECWALLGPNGAGKTTLLTVLGAVDFPSEGTVELLGRTLGRTDVRRLREEIGFVDTRAALRFDPALTVEEVVRTGATGTIGYFLDRMTQGDLMRADDLVATFGLGVLAKRRFALCSQGEQKRALIARALVARPRLLLLDEPGAGLDLPGRETLLTALDRLVEREPELALVMTTHHVEELPASTTHALLLRGGEVVGSGPAPVTMTSESLSTCFGLPLRVEQAGGRWRAVSTA
ncbi:MAG: ATP-binding cassette domain-containing protein [Actinobacteria bacterium]|nr:ATP-binding cassette domain-containing protein [Actinomycetota bacterium]